MLLRNKEWLQEQGRPILPYSHQSNLLRSLPAKNPFQLPVQRSTCLQASAHLICPLKALELFLCRKGQLFPEKSRNAQLYC